MGRYYNGTIEGKFWFAVQSSDDGEFFGAEPQENVTINYYTEDEKTAEQGVKQCEKELGQYLEKLEKFFDENFGYNNQMLRHYLKVDDDKVNHLVKWYARLVLGRKILESIKTNGYCEYEAEV